MAAARAWAGCWPPLAVLIAGWRYGPWLWGRWFSTGGEALAGFLFLAVLADMARRVWTGRGALRAPGSAALGMAAAFLLLAAVAAPRLPRLAGAGLAASALYWAFRAALPPRERAASFGWWPLLLLGLPVTASLQFVFGYPLRAFAARLAAAALPGPVAATGAGLTDGVVEVFVDAPCAGAAMLVSALRLAAGAAALFRLNGWRTTVLLLGGLGCALSANALRAALLYAATAGWLRWPLHRHETATGWACFMLSALALALAAHGLERRTRQTAANGPAGLPEHNAAGPRRPTRLIPVVFALLGMMMSAGLGWRRTPPAPSPLTSLDWPRTWEGRALIPAPESPDMAAFAGGFPGQTREFLLASPADAAATGTNHPSERLLLRYVQGATRNLHPAEDCLRGAGFRVTPLPLAIDAHGGRWSAFAYEKGDVRGAVRQRLFAVSPEEVARPGVWLAAAPGWSDVSHWYWDAATGGRGSDGVLAVTLFSQTE